MIQLENICKKYDANIVLENFCMSVKFGEMIAILGKSGSGKSTLLNILGLLEQPDSGNVIIQHNTNPKINSHAATQLRRYVIGYLFQNYALIDNLSVDKNLDVALKYAVDKNKNRKFDVLRELKIENKLYTKIYKLSGGEQQRVAIARLMLKPCELILADEPTGSLDAENRDAVIDILKQLNQNGKTIIIVTHDEVVAANCTRVIEL